MSLVRSEMNVTPLVDILLVLLVIFLTALPLTQKAIDAELPPQAQTQPAGGAQIVLEYSSDGRVSINHHVAPIDSLEARLRDIYAGRRDKTMYLAGDGSLRYQRIIDVLDAAKGAGVDRVGIITEGMRREAAARR